MAQTDKTTGANGQVATPAQNADRPSQDVHEKGKRTSIREVYDRFTYIPVRCRYDPQTPFEFSTGLNVLFGKIGGRVSFSSLAHRLTPV